MKAIRIHAHGGPEVLRLDDVPAPVAKPGEVLVRVKAAGINFIDIYQRKGIYPLTLPYTPGSEGVGIVETAGGGFTVGDRVLWVNQAGSYAESLAVATDRLVKVPAKLSDAAAVAAGLQALTAQFLCESTYAVKAGDDVLIHAGAGGVGLLLIQMAKLKGARVFTTVSSPAKAKLARDAGADEVILYTESDFAAAVKDKTGGKGVHVVYDSVGQATAMGSLSVVRPLGMLVLFGQSSGVVPPIDPLLLMRLIRHGMASAGRYLRLQVRLPDSPGSLAGLLGRLATTDANVLEVEHVRTGPQIPVNDVEIALWLETRGQDHCDQVVADLATAGYNPQVA